jgi:hypothetical protein
LTSVRKIPNRALISYGLPAREVLAHRSATLQSVF